MKSLKIFLKIILLILPLVTVGQDKIILQHRVKPNKQKVLKLDREYTIKTIDTTFYSKKIVNHTDSTLSVVRWIKSGKDSAYTYPVYGKGRDTIVFKPIYIRDTVAILFRDMISIKNDWFRHREWLEGFGYLAMGSIVGVVFLPIAAINEGKAGVKEWAIFEGIIVAICAPPLFIGTRQTKYDLKNKWIIRTVK